MCNTEVQTATQWLANCASLTTRPTQNLFSVEFNALCTLLHHHPNIDNTRHTYVTSGDHKRILNNTSPTTTTTTTKSMTTTKEYEEWQQQHHNHHHHQPWYHHQRLNNGPNDASHVVWAHGEFFYFSLRVFFILNIMDSYY